MNKWITLFAVAIFSLPVVAQVEEEEVEQTEQEEIIFEEEGEGEPDTTRVNVGNKEVLIITRKGEDSDEFDLEFDENDEPKKSNKSDAH